MLKPFFLISMMVVSLYAQADSMLDYKSAFKCEGNYKFNWYCDELKQQEQKKPPIKKEIKKEVKEEKLVPEKKEEKAPELSEFENIQKKLKELLHIAYVNPSDENLYNYIAFQNQVTNKAAIFADKWQRVLWLSPELDYSQKHPTARMAKAVSNQTLNKNRDFNLEHLKAEGYGIFFFYKNDCQYCHQMKYPLRLLAQSTKMDVMSIAVDGNISDQFPNSVADNGQAESLGVTQTPTIMLVNTKTKDIQPISTGWVSLQELEKRIYVLTATKPGDNY
ncbi:hypothetical protein JCM30760_25920 [Thiomicrorhabdus hydrogeniphila]